MIDVMKRYSDWLNSVQIFSFFEIKNINKEKHGGSFINWSHYRIRQYENVTVCDLTYSILIR